jgi:hypothetical protein
MERHGFRWSLIPSPRPEELEKYSSHLKHWRLWILLGVDVSMSVTAGRMPLPMRGGGTVTTTPSAGDERPGIEA